MIKLTGYNDNTIIDLLLDKCTDLQFAKIL